MNTNLKNEINFLVKPLSIMALVLFAIVIALVVGAKNITNIRNVITKNKTTEKSLTQKVSALETVSQALPGDVTFLDVVLPSKGSVLYALNQIRSQTVVNSLTISNLKTGNSIPESGGVMKSSVSFEISGQDLDIYAFLASLNKMLPLMNIDKVSFSSISGLLTANVSVNVYSADLPKTIPSVTGTVSELTSQDIQLLNELATYTMPKFTEPSIDPKNTQKTDPFN